MLGLKTQARRLAPAVRGGIPLETRIPASERTSQKLDELLTYGVADVTRRLPAAAWMAETQKTTYAEMRPAAR